MVGDRLPTASTVWELVAALVAAGHLVDGLVIQSTYHHEDGVWSVFVREGFDGPLVGRICPAPTSLDEMMAAVNGEGERR